MGVIVDVGYCVVIYDWWGFGWLEKLFLGYDYDMLVVDLVDLLEVEDLCDVMLVGFFMGGGEVVCYVVNYGEDCLYSVVFVLVVLFFMMKSDDNLDGLLIFEVVKEMEDGLKVDCVSFFDEFIINFFSVDGELCVIEVDC